MLLEVRKPSPSVHVDNRGQARARACCACRVGHEACEVHPAIAVGNTLVGDIQRGSHGRRCVKTETAQEVGHGCPRPLLGNLLVMEVVGVIPGMGEPVHSMAVGRKLPMGTSIRHVGLKGAPIAHRDHGICMSVGYQDLDTPEAGVPPGQPAQAPVETDDAGHTSLARATELCKLQHRGAPEAIAGGSDHRGVGTCVRAEEGYRGL
mmetsp:Transcript_128547/g.357856  ORF Transcript_128547/g.357856 Transcript_128547/m.357856 type:complete len:206 (-) Transcript_128547:453-1070(-)